MLAIRPLDTKVPINEQLRDNEWHSSIQLSR